MNNNKLTMRYNGFVLGNLSFTVLLNEYLHEYIARNTEYITFLT